jgi:serine/threonine-protein phosphatase 2A regulatory subunit A
VSGCGLFHIAYPSAPDLLRAELRSVYNQLCHDDMPMVRRSAALNLGKFAATVEAMYLKSDIMSFFRELTQDGKCALSRGLRAIEGTSPAGLVLITVKLCATIIEK